ncbi:MAG: preprotein translocase subunit SecE [Burkholderiales bacterium]|nr:MAG: preprotein translocase subunit SecE [Betaproteobacteria bacterium]TAG79044.1 MAG: preprotein translocase subunit SecE [Burkholderiales bacterium]
MNDTVKNWAIFLAAFALVALGVYGFYHFSESALVLRILMVIAGLAAGAGVAYFSQQGKDFVGFAKDSIDEGKKVAWPTRKETIQMTLIVFAFSVVLAIFLFVVDISIAAIIQWLTKRG